MSNDLVMKNIQSAMVAMGLGGGTDEDTRALAGGAGGGKRISIKGGVFRKIVGGKEIGAIDERYMNVIIVRTARAPARTFYTQGYQEGEKISPTCWSSDSVKPDADVAAPQAKSCESCPFSVKGSGQGGKGTACRLQWRTAVVLPGDVGGDVMQLVLPATSIWGDEDNGRYPLKSYARMLANFNSKMSQVVTRMQFDTKSPVPKLLFSPVEAIQPEWVPIIERQAASAAAEDAIKLTVYKTDSTPAAIPFVREVPAEVEVEVPAHEAKVEEPVLRETKKPEAAAGADVSDVIKRWSKK
jgi:hypothetical protein